MSPRKNRDKRGGYVLMGDDASTSGKAATTLVWQDSEPAFAGGAPAPRARASEQNLPDFRPARQTPRSERRAGMTPAATPEGAVPVTRHSDRRPPRRQVPEMKFPDFEALISGGKSEKSARRRSATGTPEDGHISSSGYSAYGGDPGEPEFPDLSARRTEPAAHADRYPPTRTAGSGESAHRAAGTDAARQRSANHDPLAAERAVRHAQTFTAGDSTRQEKQPLSFAFPTDEKARARRQDFEFPEMPGTGRVGADRSRNRTPAHEPEERPARRRPGGHAAPESQSATRRPVDTGYAGDNSPERDFLDAGQWKPERTGHGASADPRGSDARKVSAGTGFLDVGMPGRTGHTEKTPESLLPEEEPVFDFSTFDLSTLLPEDDTLEAAAPETPPEPVTAPQRDIPEGWTPAPEIKLPEDVPPVSGTDRPAEIPAGPPTAAPTEHRRTTAPSGRPTKEAPPAVARTGADPEVSPPETGTAQHPPVYPEYPPESPNTEKDPSRGRGFLGAGLGFAAGRASARTTPPQTPAAASPPGSSTKPPTSANKTGATAAGSSGTSPRTGASSATGQTPRPPDKATPEKKTGDRKTTDKKPPESKPQEKKLPDRKTPEYGRSQGQSVVGGAPVTTGKTAAAGTTGGKTTAAGTTGSKTAAAGTTGKTTTAGATGNGGGSGTPPSRRRRRPVMATAGQKLMILILGVALAFVLGILGGVVLSYGSWFTDDPEPGHTEDSGPTGDTAEPSGTDDFGGTTDTTENGEQTDPTDFTDSTDSTDTTDSTDSTETTDPTDSTDPTDTTEETDPNGSAPGGEQPGNNDPRPTDPKPTDPKPTEPRPTEPRPTEPRPTEPKPTEPEPTEPKPTDPPEPPEEFDPEDYFFHDADKRYLTEADYKHLTDWELVLARNEIFARHGRRFDTPEIQAYFDSCPWYKGTIDPEDFDISVLNKYERENIRILKAEGDSRKKQEEDRNKEYLIVDSDKRFLNKADYAHLDDWELILARNEIFARHGRRFDIPEIQAYFNSLSWYRGIIDPKDFDTSVLNQYERENVRVLKEEGERRDKQSGTGGSSEYFFADSDSRYLSKADYIDLTLWELILARNEIFARHGRRFDTPEIQEYFDSLSWYKGTVDPEDFDSSVFNDYELRNIQLLKAASDAR